MVIEWFTTSHWLKKCLFSFWDRFGRENSIFETNVRRFYDQSVRHTFLPSGWSDNILSHTQCDNGEFLNYFFISAIYFKSSNFWKQSNFLFHLRLNNYFMESAFTMSHVKKIIWKWSCGLVHCSDGNATDPIWRVLASSDGISSWTPLKPQHSNPKPKPNPLANQLWCIDFLTRPTPLIIAHRLPAFLESLMPFKKQSEAIHMFLWHFFKFKTEFYCIAFF